MRIWKTEVVSLVTGTGVAFAAADAFGAPISFNVPERGIVRSVVLTTEEVDAYVANAFIFDAEPSSIATNAAMTLVAADFDALQGVALCTSAIAGTTNTNFSSVGVPYRIDGGVMWVRFSIASGTPNLAGEVTQAHLMIEY